MHHCCPGRQVACEQPLAHQPSHPQGRPGPSLQWPTLGRCMRNCRPRSWSRHRRARYRAWAGSREGARGSLPGLATVQPGGS